MGGFVCQHRLTDDIANEGLDLIRDYKSLVVEAMTRRMQRQAEVKAPEKPLDQSVVNKLRALGYMD